jgi:hypothetical protein
MLAGRGDQKRLRWAIELFFQHWDDLAVRKQQTGTHIPPYGIAPYYFLYGHVYAAQAIELLDDEAARKAFRAQMAVIVERSRDEDGSWNDRQFGRSAGYGTALAIMTMQMPHLPRPLARPSAEDAQKALAEAKAAEAKAAEAKAAAAKEAEGKAADPKAGDAKSGAEKGK